MVTHKTVNSFNKILYYKKLPYKKLLFYYLHYVQKTLKVEF